ncbi:MAG: Uma2 family endonuclease, partial [Rhodothermales bacterium]|nr:Uma2 family endonuclease [Rhodothermales bacterium]
MDTAPAQRRFTVDEYYAMARAGILTADDRVELIEGRILAMSPIGSRHAACVKRLARLLHERLGDHAIVGVQDPVRLGDLSEPEPDVSLLTPRADFYAAAHPGPADVLLLVEVADTSAGVDRRVKLPLYARSGIAEVWLVVLDEDAVEVHRSPGPDGYGDRARHERGDLVHPAAFPEATLAV